MINNLYFQISGLFVILFLLKKYFTKKREATSDSKIFLILITTNLIYLGLSLLSTYSTFYIGPNYLITQLLGKLNLIIITIWIMSLTMYVYIITFKKKERINNNIFSIKQVILKRLPIYTIIILITLLLPIEMVIDSNTMYIGGYAFYFTSFVSFVCVLYWLMRIIDRHRHIKNKYTRLIISFIFIGIVTILVQILYSKLLLSDFIIYFITFIIYFNIENSDLGILEELDAVNKKLEEVEVSKIDILMKISHEIRTPLNTIIGFSGSILDESSDSVLEDVEYIKEASEKILDILNNILSISNTNNSDLILVENEYNFENFIKQIVALVKSKMDETKVEFRFKINNSMPQVLYGDSIRLKQVLINVLYNSIKYTKEGFINLDINSITIGNICRLIINITDTGTGIPEEKLDKIFYEKKYKNENLKEESEESLINTKKVLESMGGKFFLESDYGEGTSVKISVDQKIVESKIKEVIEQKNVVEKDISAKKVLIVDDDKINLKVAERLIKKYNVQTDTVISGTECLKKIDDGDKYDIIFMDEMMPNMSGTETLRQLKNTRGFNTPVVVLTANALYGMKEKYLKNGYDDYISKPIDRKELDRIINKYLK